MYSIIIPVGHRPSQHAPVCLFEPIQREILHRLILCLLPRPQVTEQDSQSPQGFHSTTQCQMFNLFLIIKL